MVLLFGHRHVVIKQAFEQINEEALKLENSYRLRYICSV